MNKKLNLFYVASLSILLMVSTVAIPLQASAEIPDATKSSVIILFNDKVSNQHKSLVTSHGGEITRTFTIINGVAANLSEVAINALERNPSIESIHPDLEAHILEMEANKIIGAYDEQNSPILNTGDTVTLAILDTGITRDHPMFNGKTIDCKSAFNRGPDKVCDDKHGHGTHVAGIAGGNGSDNLAATGVAPDVDLISYKVLDRFGSGSFSGIIEGMDYVVNNGTPRSKIISMSLGTGPVNYDSTKPNCDNYYKPMDDAIAAANAAGVTVVVAAGNSGLQGVGYPACNDQVIAVAATNDLDSIASFSSVGRAVADHGISAPGVSIYSSVPSSGDSCCSDPSLYKKLSGTSMATPVVSGSIALLLAEDGTLTPDQIKSTLFDTACTSSFDISCPENTPNNTYGHGRIDVKRAFDLISLSEILPPEPTTPTVTIDNVSVSENDLDSQIIFTVTRGGNTTVPISVTFETVDNTAAAGEDYTSKSGTLNFAGGELEKTISVLIIDDVLSESTETFNVDLLICNCTISGGNGVGTITDDDGATTITITSGQYNGKRDVLTVRATSSDVDDVLELYVNYISIENPTWDLTGTLDSKGAGSFSGKFYDITEFPVQIKVVGKSGFDIGTFN